ncbi:hypothetical protein AB0I10_32350 [Streptomyces sp. NPDC050636]|uniref:hypothetical protein n=1 Tax=Streptomyces sp. NPDC050636 TaxID=3154510 RepID=UPI00342EC64C
MTHAAHSPYTLRPATLADLEGARRLMFGEDETDVLAGAPGWWRPVVVRMLAAKEYAGFVYGFDGGGWKRADDSAEDGFTAWA